MTISRRSLMLFGWLAISTSCGGNAPSSSASDPTAGAERGTDRVRDASARNDDPQTWQTVSNPRARYLVAVGQPTARLPSVSPIHLALARRHAARTLQSMHEVEVAPAQFDRQTLSASTRRRNIGGLVLECAVVRHSVDGRGTHFAVNIAVVDLGSVNVLATLTGGATAPGQAGPDADQLALEGALDSAFRSLPRLLASLDDRRGGLALSE